MNDERVRRICESAERCSVEPQFRANIAGESVLLTGAAGYIGSALAKTLAAAHPARLALLDNRADNPHELGSVTDAGTLDRMFQRFQPRIVYHAAALKHVPALESDPLSAVRHNALGTYYVAQAALRHGVHTLVLISTDKAVNPHSIMGASKRLAELIVTALSDAACRMNAVRLGNVIGSTGSVMPIFRSQIAAGGPVTVTDPNVSRYFISLGDTVDAILAAGAAECGGRILLPDLGEPVRIADLARYLAAGSDIQIRYIGLRPGEKMHEDLLGANDIREGTAPGGLAMVRTPALAPEELSERMAQIACLLARGDLRMLIPTICAMIPEYQPSATIREQMNAA